MSQKNHIIYIYIYELKIYFNFIGELLDFILHSERESNMSLIFIKHISK